LNLELMTYNPLLLIFIFALIEFEIISVRILSRDTNFGKRKSRYSNIR